MERRVNNGLTLRADATVVSLVLSRVDVISGAVCGCDCAGDRGGEREGFRPAVPVWRRDEEDEDEREALCPYNASHRMARNSLAHHVSKCPDRPPGR